HSHLEANEDVKRAPTGVKMEVVVAMHRQPHRSKHQHRADAILSPIVVMNKEPTVQKRYTARLRKVNLLSPITVREVEHQRIDDRRERREWVEGVEPACTGGVR